MIEKEHTVSFETIEVGMMGYGNPDSPISYDKKIKNGELSPEIDARAQEFLRKGEGLVPVQERDDGCIDGHKTQELYIAESGTFYTQAADNIDHERAKVAGGGYITGQAIRLGVGVRGASIDQDLAQLGADFAEQGVYCGAHSGAHQHADGTDCGANDKFQTILANGIKYRGALGSTAEVLLDAAGLEFDYSIFNAVIDNWSDALDDAGYFKESTGASRLQTILSTQATAGRAEENEHPLAVTKHLEGDHNEAYIVVNYVDGTTLSQAKLHEHLQGVFPDASAAELPQAFVVDAWRIVTLAKAATSGEAVEEGIYAGVMYQLATAATLTDGSLKVLAYIGE